MKRELGRKVLLVLGRVVAGALVVATLAVAVLTLGEQLGSGPPERTSAAGARSELRLVGPGQGRGAESATGSATGPATKPAPQPRLHGAKPAFRAQAENGAAGKRSRSADLAAAGRTPTAGGQADLDPSPPASAAAATISSIPKGSAGSGGATIAGRTAIAAGPTALAIAREFARGFVAYETSGERSDFEDRFRLAATPELRKALLERPPKQPAGVEVPRAKVLNVVAGPARAGVQRVSVSLLRVGVTSELRLDLKKVGMNSGAEWRVANVLG